MRRGRRMERDAHPESAKDEAGEWLRMTPSRRLVESESRRRIQMEQIVTTEQALNYATALGLAVREYVTDRDTLGQIQTAFTRIMSGGGFVVPDSDR